MRVEVARVKSAGKALLEFFRAPRARRLSYKVFSDAFEHAPVGVALLSPEGRWLKVNRALCELTGYTPAELLARTFQDITHPDDLATCLENVHRLLAGEISSYFGEKRYVHAQGQFVLISFNLSLVRDKKAQPSYFIAQINDITDRRKAEREVALSEQRYRSLVEATTAIVWTTAGAGRFEDEQNAWSAFTGQSHEQLRGEGWLDVIHPDDRAETKRNWDAAVASQANYKVEHRIRAADGSYRDMRGRAVPIFGEGGAVVQWSGVHYDITDRKRKEEELRWKTALLEAQLNSSLDGILVIDDQGNKILQNERAAALWSIPAHLAAEVNDDAQLEWVTRMVKDPERFKEKIVHLYSHPDEVSQDEVELTNGAILARYSSPVIGEDKKYFGRIWTFRDVTESKRLEAQFVQSQRLETVGKLAGGVAHEFNSIMTAIIGQSELLLDGLAPGDALARNAAEIHRAAERAATLTRQLLAYGRKQILRPELLDLNSILANIAEGLRHLMGARIEVRIEPAEGLKMVKADAGQIGEVIMNMAMNSACAMPEGGAFTIASANLTLDEEHGARAGLRAEIG